MLAGLYTQNALAVKGFAGDFQISLGADEEGEKGQAILWGHLTLLTQKFDGHTRQLANLTYPLCSSTVSESDDKC